MNSEEAKASTSDPHYTQCPCEFCGAPVRFQSTAAGHKAECPDCGRTIVLGAVAVTALTMHGTTAERIRCSERNRMTGLTIVLGWLLFGSGLLTLVSLMISPMLVGEALLRGTALFLSLVAAGAGPALMLEGRHVRIYWICSACQCRLAHPNDLTCTGCASELQ